MFSRVLVNCVVISLMHSIVSANCKRGMFLYPSNLDLPCSSNCCCWVSAAPIFAWIPLRVLVSSAVESRVGDHSASNLCRRIPPSLEVAAAKHTTNSMNNPRYPSFFSSGLVDISVSGQVLDKKWSILGWPWMWVTRVCILVSNWWTIDHRVYPHISCYIAVFCVYIYCRDLLPTQFHFFKTNKSLNPRIGLRGLPPKIVMVDSPHGGLTSGKFKPHLQQRQVINHITCSLCSLLYNR